MRSLLPKRGLWAVMALVLATAALPAAAFIGNLRGPKVDGELALPGLSAPVRVQRDEHGIPYIFAANTPDLIRAQGFVVAQGRLFQIEGYRAAYSTPSRTPFRSDDGQHSTVMADTVPR